MSLKNCIYWRNQILKVPQMLVMYLPQFHKVKDDDEWWGDGFTEWHTVKAAKPLYLGHCQPVQPIEYYNLLNYDVLKTQAGYMHQYGMDGMCFYHYYFENGKKILEKPAENLLCWTDIDIEKMKRATKSSSVALMNK